jgi:hypothetical protein
MSFVETLHKNASIRNFADVTDKLSETIDDLVPIKYHNKILNRLDFGLELGSVQKMFPFIITNVDSNTKSIDYISLIPILIKEIQDLKQEIAELKPKEVHLDRSSDYVTQIKPVFKK